MPMKTTLLTRSGESSGRRRARRAAATGPRATTCSTISAVDMLRVRPGLPGGAERAVHAAAGLARHADGDPARVAHEHALDQGPVEQPPDGLDRRALVGLEGAHRGEQLGQQARPASSSRIALGRSVMSSGAVDQPLEVVRRRAAWRGSPSARAPPRPPRARPASRSARCRGGLPRRGAAKVSWPGVGRRVGAGRLTGAAGVVGSEAVIPPSVSAVRTKGQTRPAAPRRRGPRAAGSRAGPSARRGPAGCCPCP